MNASGQAQHTDGLGERVALGELVELLQQDRSPQSFFKAVLESVARAVETPYAALEVNVDGVTIEREYHTSSKNHEFWKDVAHRVLTETLSSGGPTARLYDSAELSVRVAVLGVVLRNLSGAVIGGISLVVACEDELEAKETLAFLHSLTLLVSAYGGAPTAQADPAPSSTGAPSGATLSRLAGFSSATQLAFSVVNGLQNRAQCEQVALARVSDGEARLVAISGLSEVRRNTPGVAAIEGAVNECLDLGEPIIAGGEVGPARSSRNHPLHQAWRESTSGDNVATVPFFEEDECRAVLALRRAKGATISPEDLDELRGLAAPYVVGLDLVERATRGLGEHARATAREALTWWKTPGDRVRKAGFALLGLALCWLLFGRMTYRVSTPCTVSSDSVRQIAASQDGVLRRAGLAPGDRFRAGDVLCELDTTDLELERDRNLAELRVLELQWRGAAAEGAVADAELFRLQRAALEAVIASTELKLEASVVRAPFDGMVLDGDLRFRVGDFVAKGEPLLELSPERGWRLELHVPASDIAHVRPGATGRFASQARPEERHALEVHRILPSAQVKDGTTVYVVEASSDVDVEWMLAGMEGTCLIDGGERPVWWILSHGLLDRLRLGFWL